MAKHINVYHTIDSEAAALGVRLSPHEKVAVYHQYTGKHPCKTPPDMTARFEAEWRYQKAAARKRIQKQEAARRESWRAARPTLANVWPVTDTPTGFDVDFDTFFAAVGRGLDAAIKKRQA